MADAVGATYEGKLQGEGLSFGIVIGRFNEFISGKLLSGALDCLTRHGVAPSSIEVAWVPGAFEIPLAAQAFARSGRVDAVIGLGCVIRGATTHYEAVAGESAAGILRAGLATGVPVIFGVLTTEDLDQALERSEGVGGHNVGEESAHTAVEMVRLLERIDA